MSFEKNLRKVVPYVPGEQPTGDGIIKLNTNENPYPPSKKVLEALSNININQLKLYPNPASQILIDALSKRYNVSKEKIFAGVGSDDVLATAFMTMFNSDKPILFSDITYSFYCIWADLFKVPYEQLKLDKDFRIISDDYKKENGGIIIANPNAPTGIAESLETIEDIVKNNQESVVIVDEAYVDFGGESAISLIDKYENLLVVQTFSKSRSLASMRIGMAFGSEKLIKAMKDVKYSFNSYTINETALVAGVASLEDEQYFINTVNKVVATRERVKEELKELGFTFGDSKTNFIFATHKIVKAEEIYEALRKEKIYIRYFPGERTKDYLRISIGTDEEMDKLIAFIKDYIERK